MKTLRIGFLPLVDAATLIAAAEFGFAEAEGLVLDLQKDISWANLRDKLTVGQLDAAHLLGALAVATSLGIGQRRFPLRAPLLLSRGGNAITLATRIADELLSIDPACLDDWRLTARTLARSLKARRAAGKPRMTFGTVYPFSTHTYLLRRFLEAGGINADLDVEIVVTPPPYAMDLADRGAIDGFCVGGPWNSLAVQSGKGVIVALGNEIVPDAPEKVLALASDSPLLEDSAGVALARAIVNASNWAASRENWDPLAEALARPDRIGCDMAAIRRTIAGDVMLDSKGRMRHDPRFLRISGSRFHCPAEEDALWLYGEMARANQTTDAQDARRQASGIFSSELYQRAMV